MEGITTRALTSADAPALASLLRAARPEYVARFHPFAFEAEIIRAELTGARRDQYWGYWSGGELAGFYMLRGLDAGYERPAFGVYVAEGFAGQGLGRLALRESIAWCAAHGVEELMLKVHPENLRALALYQAAGFAETGYAGGQIVMTRKTGGTRDFGLET